MKYIVSFFVGVLLSGNLSAQVVDRIVAQIDDKVITSSDIEVAIRYYEQELLTIEDPAERQRIRQDFRSHVVQRVINDKLLLEEFERQKITVSDEEMERAFQEWMAGRRLTEQQVISELSRMGGVLKEFKENFRKEIQKNQFMQKVIYPRIRLSDYDLEQYYKQHLSLFRGFEKVRFMEIVLTPDSPPSGEALEPFVQKVFDQLRKGASFSEMVKKYSKGAYADRGGDSGLIPVSMLRPELRQIVMGIPLHMVSNPVPLPNNGFLICKVVERSQPKTLSFQEAKEMVRQRYLDGKIKDELEAYLMEARNSHFIEIKS